MKLYYCAVFLFFSIGMVLLLSSCKKQDDGLATPTSQVPKSKSSSPKENTYEPLRYMALQVTPKDLKLSLSSEKAMVYGIVMDWEMGGSTVTTVAYQTGDASMYLSTGYAIIGGGAHEAVNESAKRFVALGQSYFEKAETVDGYPMPDPNTVVFYLLTTRGTFVCKEEMSHFEDKSSYFLPLFEEGNKVLTELRKIEQAR